MDSRFMKGNTSRSVKTKVRWVFEKVCDTKTQAIRIREQLSAFAIQYGLSVKNRHYKGTITVVKKK